ncbi:MAG: hypothetical protein EU550_00720 [Promethearchaeota archaeon]|nr:MAG: hypothetical protein EU550_00720 [Candidatus Lokiarchaeota archaeon]
MSERECPYCGEKLKHPYWTHVQKKHPEEYEKKFTWIQLFEDYKNMGMQSEVSLNVIAELFNTTPDEVKFFLKQKNVL